MSVLGNNNNIKFPYIFSLSTGKTQLVDEDESIKQSIALIILTSKGELLGDPNYGSRIRELVYNHNNDSIPELVIEDILVNVSVYEKRIDITQQDISVTYEDNKVNISISYTIKKTGKRSLTDIVVLRGDNY